MSMSKFKLTALSTVIALSVSTGYALADNQKQMSKPEGAKGNGVSTAFTPKSNNFWWPDQLDLTPLRSHDARSNPYGEDFN